MFSNSIIRVVLSVARYPITYQNSFVFFNSIIRLVLPVARYPIIYQKGPVLSWQRRLNSLKKALHSLKKDLYFLKEPFILSREPCILSKEPCFLSKEPCVLSKEPCILSKGPCILCVFPSQKSPVFPKNRFVFPQKALYCLTQLFTGGSACRTVPHTFSKEPFIVLKKALCTLGNNPVFLETTLCPANSQYSSVLCWSTC